MSDDGPTPEEISEAIKRAATTRLAEALQRNEPWAVRLALQRDLAGRFAPDNQESLKHGIERSVKALATGGELVGRAHDAQLQVHSELETAGAIALLRRNVERTQAVTDLVWFEIVAAIQADDAETFDRWVRRHGWLVGVVNRAIQQLRDFEIGADRGTSARHVLNAIRSGDSGDGD